jgi:hypothetical protein
MFATIFSRIGSGGAGFAGGGIEAVLAGTTAAVVMAEADLDGAPVFVGGFGDASDFAAMAGALVAGFEAGEGFGAFAGNEAVAVAGAGVTEGVVLAVLAGAELCGTVELDAFETATVAGGAVEIDGDAVVVPGFGFAVVGVADALAGGAETFGCAAVPGAGAEFVAFA